MKTRSTRFFAILLHLLGVSNHHLPSWYYDYLTSTTDSDRSSFYSGIRGVHPHNIVLERLDLREVGGLDAVDWLTDSSTRESFWLQDTEDGKCLGPSGGFSECGDATLWFVLKRGAERKSLRMGPFGVEEVLELVDPEEPYRYALQIVDNDYLQQGPGSSPPSAAFSFSSWILAWRQRRQQMRQRDCLVPSTNNRRQSDPDSPSSSLDLGSCAKQKTAWSWRVDSQGLLYLPKDASTTRGRECIQRTQTSSAVLSSCEASTAEGSDANQSQQRLVQFALVRYHATTSHTPVAPSPTSSDAGKLKARPMTTLDSRTKEGREVEGTPETKGGSREKGLPSNRDRAHSHASEPVVHLPIFEMNLAGRPLLSKIPSREARKESGSSSPFEALKDTNPILFLSTETMGRQGGTNGPKKAFMDNKKRVGNAPPTPAPHTASPTPVKLRKIEMNPYIAASKDEKWVDPQTGLVYHTDLCQYLGHDRKEYGRHTLVGVGQYMKTMLKIKVYGIALYVSKRDVLADPSFQEYAGLSAEELRNRPDFYDKLRTLPPSNADPSEGGRFDRTIFLKTNMQLSIETMRSSLDSDWKLLTEEAKALLIDTSMRPRPADEQMLQEIQRADNPSRCSCAQVAPEEFAADRNCCARGIELVFTWRKNGDVEVRLNGRLMDSFPRPDIGHGIFYEYLNRNDPFSFDFIERAVDGFPHLLSPLAQVQGITSSVMQTPLNSAESPSKSFVKAFSGAAEMLYSHAADFVGALQHGAGEAAANAAHAAESARGAMIHFAEEGERKRQDVWKKMMELTQRNPTELLAQFAARSLASGGGQDAESDSIEPEPQGVGHIHGAPRGRFLAPATSKWFGETLEAPDEIGPMIHPTMNRTILSLVHLYLLLILIISFPPTNSNRTRFVVRRSCKMMSVSTSESSLIERIEKGRDSILIHKEKNQILLCEIQNVLAAGKKVAPEPPGSDGADVEMHPEDDADPAAALQIPQRIRIDLSSPEGCKKTRSSNGNTRLFRVHRSSETKGGDSSELASARSSNSVGSGGRARPRNRKKKVSTNDQMKKSLSYFL